MKSRIGESSACNLVRARHMKPKWKLIDAMRDSCMLENNCLMNPFLWHKKRNSWVKVWFEMQSLGFLVLL